MNASIYDLTPITTISSITSFISSSYQKKESCRRCTRTMFKFVEAMWQIVLQWESHFLPRSVRECTYYPKWKILSERKSVSESNILLREGTSVFLMSVHASQRIWECRTEVVLLVTVLQEIIPFSSKTDKWWGNCPSYPLQIGSIILDEGSSNNNHFTINLFRLLPLSLCAAFWMKLTLLLCR